MFKLYSSQYNNRIDNYLAGSNAYMLPGELATLLSGRFVRIEMLPFSFSTFVQAKGQGKSLDENYQEYIKNQFIPVYAEFE